MNVIKYTTNPAGIYLLKPNNEDTKTKCEIQSKSIINSTAVVLMPSLSTPNKPERPPADSEHVIVD